MAEIAVAAPTNQPTTRKAKEMATPSRKHGDGLRHFYAHINDQTDECMIWPYGKTAGGYGQVRLAGVTHPVHVLACEYANGPRNRWHKMATHRCRNRACWNPRHLTWGTYHTNNVADRIRDGIKPGGSGRGHRGEKR